MIMRTLPPVFVASLVASAFSASFCFAGNVIEKRGRMEINWSTQRLRYYGESQMAAGQETSYKNAEYRARREGYSYLETAWPDAKPLVDSGLALTDKSWPNRAKDLSAVSTSFNTAYFADGKVRVYLEVPLAKVNPQTPASHATAEGAKADATGVIINLVNADKPLSSYRIELDDGATVFRPEDVTAAAFNDRSMGYWFKKAKDKELSAVVGSKPVVLEARLAGDGVLKVSKQAWDAVYGSNQKLFADAKIALNLP